MALAVGVGSFSLLEDVRGDFVDLQSFHLFEEAEVFGAKAHQFVKVSTFYFVDYFAYYISAGLDKEATAEYGAVAVG